MVLSLRTKSRRQIRGCDLAQPDVELIDFNNGGRLAHSMSNLTMMSCHVQPL